MVRKMELFGGMDRKKKLVVAMAGRHGAFWTCQEEGAFLFNGQEEGACCCYGQKEWSLLDMVRKMELFDAIVRKRELVVSMVRRNGAFWTWSGRWSF